MDISYRLVEPENVSDMKAIWKWENDQDSRHFFQVHQNEMDLDKYISLQSITQMFLDKQKNENRSDWIVFLDDRRIGFMNAELDPPQNQFEKKNTAWLALVIGESGFRGKGVGTMILTDLCRFAAEMGATWAEVGVFAFNHPARALYRKLGFEEFLWNLEFTYWGGKMQHDIRMVKSLTSTF